MLISGVTSVAVCSCVSSARRIYRESYICDTTALKQRLQSFLSSMSDCSAEEEAEEEEDGKISAEVSRIQDLV